MNQLISKQDLEAIGIEASIARRVCEGPYAQIKRSFYQKRRFASGTPITAGQDFNFFQSGLNDPATDLGYASGQITLAESNMEKGGRVPEQELFVVFGVSHEFNYSITAAILAALELGYTQWQYNAKNRNLRFGQLIELPPVYNRVNNFGSGAATPGDENNIHRGGPPFVQRTPMFVLLGSQFKVEQGLLNIEFPTAHTPGADTYLTMRLHGVHFQQY